MTCYAWCALLTLSCVCVACAAGGYSTPNAQICKMYVCLLATDRVYVALCLHN